jgi:hypothetical protein
LGFTSPPGPLSKPIIRKLYDFIFGEGEELFITPPQGERVLSWSWSSVFFHTSPFFPKMGKEGVDG